MNPSIITRLRDTVPLRPLRYSEALRLAELQAQSSWPLLASPNRPCLSGSSPNCPRCRSPG